jgi:hypothetical protein
MEKKKTIHKRGKSYQLTLKSDGDLYSMHITDGTYNTYQQLRGWQSFECDSFLDRCIDDFERSKHNIPKQTKMKPKEVTVIPPEGYEIDRENSTLERIVFKEIAKVKALPKTWEELGEEVSGFWIENTSEIRGVSHECANDYGRNIWPSYDEAKASLALAQLFQLRDRYNDGWKPDWTAVEEFKYVIGIRRNEPTKHMASYDRFVLCFQTPELQDEFMQNFRDLIEIAKPLL